MYQCNFPRCSKETTNPHLDQWARVTLFEVAMGGTDLDGKVETLEYYCTRSHLAQSFVNDLTPRQVRALDGV